MNEQDRCWETLNGRRSLDCCCKRCTSLRGFREWRKHHPEEVDKWVRANPEEYKRLIEGYSLDEIIGRQ